MEGLHLGQRRAEPRNGGGGHQRNSTHKCVVTIQIVGIQGEFRGVISSREDMGGIVLPNDDVEIS